MNRRQKSDSSKYKDLAVLAIVPVAVALLTLASWILAHWDIGPYFVNAALAIIAVIFGGFQRFIGGFKDIFKRKITVNVFVVVALVATMAIGEFRPAAIIVFIMAAAGALESYTLDKTRKSIRDLLDFAPSMAIVRREGAEVIVPAAELHVGDIVVVKPGA
jgi:Cd2+/Zn2+-exporting ATPase